ncbi:serine/threonine-protein kinase pdik1l-A-like [Branchiostoma floridae x Branchiostoma belcheri]
MTGAIKELNILENLKPHQHIAKFIEHKVLYTPSHNCIWLFLEFCDGGTLGDYVFRNPRDVPAKRQLAFQLADAVAFLHDQHIVHRDLKPQNLMIKDGTDFPILKVVDFGLATVCSRLDPTKVHDYFTGSLGGTLFYVAPEVLSSGQNWTTAVDVFSMGLLFWAMFDNLNATSNTDLEPYLAPFVKSPTGAGYSYSEPIGQVLARGGSVDHNEVMRNDPKRRNLVFTMIDPDYKKRPTASEVFNNLKMIEDGYTGYTDTEDRNESYQHGNVDRAPTVDTIQNEHKNACCQIFSTISLSLLYCLIQLLKAVVLLIITIPFILVVILNVLFALYLFFFYLCCSDSECLAYVVKFKMVPSAFEHYKNVCSRVVNFQKSFPPCS